MRHRDVKSIFYVTFVTVMLIGALPMGCARQETVLTISGDEDAEGATVVVNGRSVGSMKKSAGSVTGFTMNVAPGTLLIEVKKAGYRPFHEALTLTSNEREHHVNVKLAQEVLAAPDTQNNAMPGTPVGPPASKPANSGVPVCPD
ncbi:MAG TPA: PEGA domain-containing protein [Nitrospiraceae bacterium]|nr:PEGA domain-containing protein [Nitrospiraceae bacterium]